MAAVGCAMQERGRTASYAVWERGRGMGCDILGTSHYMDEKKREDIFFVDMDFLMTWYTNKWDQVVTNRMSLVTVWAP